MTNTLIKNSCLFIFISLFAFCADKNQIAGRWKMNGIIIHDLMHNTISNRIDVSNTITLSKDIKERYQQNLFDYSEDSINARVREDVQKLSSAYLITDTENKFQLINFGDLLSRIEPGYTLRIGDAVNGSYTLKDSLLQLIFTTNSSDFILTFKMTTLSKNELGLRGFLSDDKMLGFQELAFSRQ